MKYREGKCLVSSLVAASFLICAASFGGDAARSVQPEAPSGLLQGTYELNPTFSDEFEKPFDESKWYDFYPTWNGRAGGFHFARKNVSVSDGKLVLTARAEDPKTVSPELRAEGKERFSTAAFRSKTRVLYGYYELKFKSMDACVCNAFWLNDPVDAPQKYCKGDKTEEIDIFEVFGKSARKPKDNKTLPHHKTYFTTTHIADTPYVESKVWLGRKIDGKKSELEKPLSTEYHTAGFLWTPEKLVWILDGKIMDERVNNDFHRAMYLNIDCEVMSAWAGEPDAKDLPAKFNVEYVRVWQQKK